jgi:protein XagA
MIMKFTKTQIRSLLIAIVILIASRSSSYAGGFPVRPGSLLISPSVSYFYANKGWDSTRHLASFPNGGHFSSYTLQLYTEYGISRRFTFVAQLPYVSNTYEQTNYKSSASGLTDLEAGLRYYIANIDYRFYFMVQGMAITPLYTNPSLGYGQSGAELKFLFSGSVKVFGTNAYFSAENGFRQYFGSTGPFQDRYSGTFGLNLDKKFQNQISVALGGFYSISTNKQFSPVQYTNKDFSFNQVSLSYGHTFSREFSIFLTGGKFINGRNTGDGASGSVALILRPF